MEKNNVFDWLKRIIDTCNNDFHFDAIDKLIELFKDKYGDAELVLELEILRKEKWNKIHTILL